MPKKEVSKNDKKEKKENKHFFKDFKAELKRVIWPTPKQLVNNTVAVITIVLITAIIVFALDLVFELMNNYGINKIKEAVEASNVQMENTTNNELDNSNVTNETETNSTENEENESNSEEQNANNEEQQENAENKE